MRQLAMVVVLVIVVVGLVCFWHGRLKDNAQKVHKDYVLQVDDHYLGCNEDCVVNPRATDDGWATVEVRANSELYRFEAEQANGVFEPVTKGEATLAASCKTTRVVKVYRKDEDKLFSIHLIDIEPHY